MIAFSATVRSVRLRWLTIIPLAFALAFAVVKVVAGPATLTLNITVTDAAGGRLVGLAGERPLVIVRVLNATDQCSDFVCYFNETFLNINLTLIQVNVSVYWFGVLVYEKSFHAENGSRTDLLARVNASTVKLILVNDMGEALKDCEAYLVGLNPKISTLNIVNGQTASLPFGAYNVSSARCKVDWTSAPVAVPVLNPSFQVYNGTKNVSVRLGVAGVYKLELRRADGSPLVGARVKVEYIEAKNATVFEGTVNVGYVTLNNLPYGRYLVTVSWQGEPLLNSVIEVNGLQRGINLTTSLLPLVTLTVLDADSQPVAGVKLKIVRAAGGATAFDAVSDIKGQIVLGNIVPGSYIVSSSWLNYTFSIPVYISGFATDVKLPLRKVQVKVGTEPACGGSCSLPPGLSAELWCGGVMLANASLSAPSAELVLEPRERVYVNAPLKLKVFWNGTKLLEKDLSADVGVLSATLPFYNISLNIVDAFGKPLPDTYLKITDDLGVKVAKSDLEGVAEVGFVYGRKVRVEAFWGEVPVAREVVTITSEAVQIKAAVYTVKVEVLNALGQPVAQASVTAWVNGSGYSFKSGAVTRDDGAAELKLPVPPNSQVLLEVGKGRVRLTRQLLTDEVNNGATRVVLDLLVDFGPLQLRVGEVAGLALAVAVAILASLVALRIWGRRTASRGLFEVYGGRSEAGEEEEEEASWRSVLGRFKEVFGAEKEKEEEAEEEGLFDEL